VARARDREDRDDRAISGPFAADPPMPAHEYEAAKDQLALAARALDAQYTTSQTYPRWAYHATEPPRLIHSDEDAQALGEGWSPVPVGDEPAPPVVTALEPDTAVIGTPSFTLHVHGTGFLTGSVIVFNGFDEPTTVVSTTEVTTGVNMAVWAGPSEPLPVTVRNGAVVSNALTFTFTAPETPGLRLSGAPPVLRGAPKPVDTGA